MLHPSMFGELTAVGRERRSHRPSPPTSGLVLEIGAGQAPHPRTDVVVDKYIDDDFERPGEQGMSFGRPLVVADGAQLPFADQSFAYVIAMHVLEHAPDPVSFAAEMSRVGAAGFVQVPSRQSEVTFGWPYHPWLIDLVGQQLRFTPRGDATAPVGPLFHESFASSPLMRLWWAAHRSVWHHSVPWSGHLDVEVDGNSEAPATATYDHERTVAALTAAYVSGRTRPLPGEVRERLRCPACRSTLSYTSPLVCDSCDRAYPVIGHTPILL
jgi:SAM-dependent methyltransferase